MTIFQLSKTAVSLFAGLPEHGMGFQFAISDQREISLVIGGRVLYRADDKDDKHMRSYLSAKWLSPSCDDNLRADRFEDWIKGLPNSDDPEPFDDDTSSNTSLSLVNLKKATALAFRILTPSGPMGPLPPFGTPYGHLPFTSRVEANDVFYRYEPFPTSRRIDRKTKKIAVDTFAVPASETPFLPTGLSVVARLALPNLFPATFCWAIQPRRKDQFMCGASVPAFGQSGGGVEVKFHKGATNRCEFADPVLLPPL